VKALQLVFLRSSELFVTSEVGVVVLVELKEGGQLGRSLGGLRWAEVDLGQEHVDAERGVEDVPGIDCRQVLVKLRVESGNGVAETDHPIAATAVAAGASLRGRRCQRQKPNQDQMSTL